MKKILYTILKTVLLLPLLAACSSENDSFLPGAGTEGNAIVLQFSTGDVPLSRATVPSEEGAEVAVKHLDVFIFEESGGKKHYERVTGCTNKEGTVTLAAKREDFAADTGYWVYLIANSTHATTEFDAIADLNSLKAMTQQDRDIFLTGLGDISEAPQSFLMDGIAYADAQEPAAAAPVVLYNGVKSDDTKLKVTLRRAAAKVIVHIKKGEKVTFDQELEGAIPGYYLRNMPYTTSLLAGVGGEADLRTPDLVNTDYFDWTAEQITVTTYAYAHEWADASLEKEVRLVVNIPMKYKKDNSTEETAHVSSYYQIPISKDKVLKRNTCYQVTVTVNAPGALDPSEPEELTDIQYSVKDWENIYVDINGDERPIFLYVNEEEMEMHNIAEDSTTLYFTSSSEVTATIDKVYYTDKFGQTKTLVLHTDGDNNYAEKVESKEWWGGTTIEWINKCKIQITPDDGINGKIDVYSTIPDNNTIRYIDITIKNKEGIERKVTIAQYPLEYITNIQSKYSYRDDFKINDSQPTTYYYKGDRVYGISLATRNITNWNGQYTYEVSERGWGESNTSSGFFRSKFVSEVNEGKSTILHYYWNSRNQLTTSSSGEYNGRLYHIRLTATSDTYTVGVPRLIEDEDNPGLMVTDPGKDNEMLVSPSFMIASSLGGFMLGSGNLTLDDSQNSLRVAREHCANYVEVAWDGTVYDDWRLPTRAELNIIMNFQGSENEDADAIDYLLNAQYYYSANGRVENSKKNMNGTGVRCIRDAYETE